LCVWENSYARHPMQSRRGFDLDPNRLRFEEMTRFYRLHVWVDGERGGWDKWLTRVASFMGGPHRGASVGRAARVGRGRPRLWAFRGRKHTGAGILPRPRRRDVAEIGERQRSRFPAQRRNSVERRFDAVLFHKYHKIKSLCQFWLAVSNIEHDS